METVKNYRILIPAMIGFIALILDGPTAVEGVRAGLEVCLYSVLPSLFPFVFLSSLLTNSLASGNFKSHRFISRVFLLPSGAEGILFTGLLGGYPVGARCIGEAVKEGQLTERQAQKMLVFCNAAGPAFLFGITGTLFAEHWIPWALWGIHLLSCLVMAKLMHVRGERIDSQPGFIHLSISQRLRQSIQIMGDICGWIILMRCLITLMQKWLLWRLPKPLQVLIIGTIELSNGCLSLSEVSNTGLRFVLCSVFLAFGGLCVALQTCSAASMVSQKLYLPGKCMQGLISFILAYILQFIIFPPHEKVQLPWLFCLSLVIVLFVFIYTRSKRKNSCGNLEYVGV